ncbi:MAG: hypothetical protein ACHQ53_17195 [Polyangiales bacterium]
MRCIFVALLFCVVSACTNEPQYVGDGKLYQVALTSSTPAAFTSMDGAVYIVEQRVELEVRRPSQIVLDDLRKGAGAYKNLPFPRLPWIDRGEMPMEVDFTLSNLDATPHDVTVTLNGFSEFDEYVPGIHVVDEQVQADYAEWERSYKLDAKQRISGTIREEDMDEAAVDLATAAHGAPNANEVVYFENKSGSDPRSDRFTPKVVPGLVGFRIGLRSQEEAATMRQMTAKGGLLLEATTRVRDVSDKLTTSQQTAMRFNPQPFTPMPPAAMP